MTQPTDEDVHIPTIELKEEDSRSYNDQGLLESGLVRQVMLVDGEEYTPPNPNEEDQSGPQVENRANTGEQSAPVQQSTQQPAQQSNQPAQQTTQTPPPAAAESNKPA
jgi:hypothetical protein